MSTTFAIIKKCKCGEIKEQIEIARRSAQGHGKPQKIKWLHPFVDVLQNKREVYPIDNTNQGVYNIGDLRKLHNEYKKGVKNDQNRNGSN